KEAAIESGCYYVVDRWIGGILSNFEVIKASLERLKTLEEYKSKGVFKVLPPIEAGRMIKEYDRLLRLFEGLKGLDSKPDVVIVFDTIKDKTAVSEAIKTNTDIIAILDTNCDPTGIRYPIPGNDDAIKSVSTIVGILKDSIIEARNMFKEVEVDVQPV
ncbi:MAG: 30S ribosomal protein S2, partial [bacterium]|nr:30S ribosomal protein S2 [bacterium]